MSRSSHCSALGHTVVETEIEPQIVDVLFVNTFVRKVMYGTIEKYLKFFVFALREKGEGVEKIEENVKMGEVSKKIEEKKHFLPVIFDLGL